MPEEGGQQPALERLAIAIESEVADRKAERKRHEQAEQREAALLSALLLFVISLGFADIMIGDPLSKGFFSHQSQLPVIIPVVLAALAFLYRAFSANVISGKMTVYLLLFCSAVAGFVVFLMKGQVPRIGGSVIGVAVFYQFIKYFLPLDKELAERMDNFEGWVNSRQWPKAKSPATAVLWTVLLLALVFTLPLLWFGYVYGLVPDQVGWLPGIVAWLLVFGVPMWERWTRKPLWKLPDK